MKKRNIWAIFGITAAIAAALIMACILIAGMVRTADVSGQLSVQGGQPSGTYVAADARRDLKVFSPGPDQKISNPLVVSGEARGWFFEGSFPVELRDANGVTLAATPAQAQGEWMSPDFVPFSAVMFFTTPSTPTGTIILKKDNPSGLPQYDAQVVIPVDFQL